MDAQAALVRIIETANRKHHYASRTYERYKEPIFMDIHPFTRDKTETVWFIGSPGHTASVGMWLWHILNVEIASQLFPLKPLLFRVWKVKQERGCDIYFEVQFGKPLDSYLCGGMTDYSGEGGRAYKEYLDVVLFLTDVFDAVIETKVVSTEEGERAWNEISKAIDEQLVTE